MAFLQTHSVAILLIVVMILGIASQNSTVSISAAILLIVQQTALSKYLPLLDKYGLKLGIVILTIGVLAPLVSGRIKLPEWHILISGKMLAAVVTGIFVAWMGGRGVALMGVEPVLVAGLMLGTIIGVAFFGGIPVGPLIAAGLLSLLFSGVNYFK